MNFDEYQSKARSTAIYDKLNYRVVYPALGLTGEAGEVAEKVKKKLRGDHEEFDVEGLEKELGDVLWYLANLAEDLGLSLQTIAEKNIAKLQSRKERGVIHGSGDAR